MEFNKLANTNSGSSANMSVVRGGKSTFVTSSDKMGVQALLPEAHKMLSGLFAAYGLQYPEINMADPKFKDKAVAVGKVAEIAQTNTAALEQMLKHTASLMAGQIKLAEFYAASTQIVVEGKKRIDAATAQSFLTVADYQKHSASLADKVNRKLQLLDKKYELVGQLGEGKLATALNLIEAQKGAGEKRQQATQQLHNKRQDILAAAGIKREKDREYIRYGHLAGAGAR